MLQTFCSCLEKQPLPKPGTLLGCEAIWKVVRENTELVRALPDGPILWPSMSLGSKASRDRRDMVTKYYKQKNWKSSRRLEDFADILSADKANSLYLKQIMDLE
jgi:hypothetical protein